MNADLVSKEQGTAESSVTAFFGKLADTWKTSDGAAFASPPRRRLGAGHLTRRPACRDSQSGPPVAVARAPEIMRGWTSARTG